MRTLLLLRPEPGLGASIARARALGMDPVGVPLFEVTPLHWTAPPPDQFDALLLTSANAIRYGGEGLTTYRDVPVHAVGATTAEAARGAGFSVVHEGAADLVALLAEVSPSLRLLHLGGVDRTTAPHGWKIVSVPVYEARTIDPVALPPLNDMIVAVHSPRAGRRLSELAADKATATIVAISDAAAEACGAGWRGVSVADAPNDEALLALAHKLCQTISP